jgi:glycosyltransferase involved in cell wall biosynthesis
MGGSRLAVVLLVENLPVPLDRRVWQEAQALHADGWNVSVIGPRGDKTMRAMAETIDGIHVYRYPQRAASGPAGYLIEYLPSLVFTAIWLARVRLRGRIHVIHGCNPPDLFWIFGMVGQWFGARYVFDQHDANPELASTKWGDRGIVPRLLRSATRWLELRSYSTADLVIAPNQSYRALAVGRGNVAPEKVVVVRNAPNVSRYRSLSSHVVPSPHRVGYVGVMGSQDGLELLIAAWRLVRDAPNMTDATLELVGDGEARSALEGQAKALGLKDSVRFHGYLQPDQFVPILASCSACVAPDPPTPFNNISTMVKVIDYLAIGRPTISFDLDETRLAAGAAARIVSDPTPRGLAEGILSLLRNADERLMRSSACAERVEALHLDWNYSAGLLRRRYRTLVSGIADCP